MLDLLDCYSDPRWFAVYQLDFAAKPEGSFLDLIDDRIQGSPGVHSGVVPYLVYLAMNFRRTHIC